MFVSVFTTSVARIILEEVVIGDAEDGAVLDLRIPGVVEAEVTTEDPARPIVAVEDNDLMVEAIGKRSLGICTEDGFIEGERSMVEDPVAVSMSGPEPRTCDVELAFISAVLAVVLMMLIKLWVLLNDEFPFNVNLSLSFEDFCD